MLTPRYFFTNDFSQFYDYFLSAPHRKRSFKKGQYLWEPNQPFQKIHYIVSGLAQSYAEHENGHRKIISFHGTGTVFPGYHQHDFRIEGSLITKALSDMEVLEFTKAEFQRMFEENQELRAGTIEWYSMYVNLLLYDAVHQEYNNSFMKTCNLLYLLLENQPGLPEHVIEITQDDMADILGISRVNLARVLAQLRNEKVLITHRKLIEIIDPDKLALYCSLETI